MKQFKLYYLTNNSKQQTYIFKICTYIAFCCVFLQSNKNYNQLHVRKQIMFYLKMEILHFCVCLLSFFFSLFLFFWKIFYCWLFYVFCIYEFLTEQFQLFFLEMNCMFCNNCIFSRWKLAFIFVLIVVGMFFLMFIYILWHYVIWNQLSSFH